MKIVFISNFLNHHQLPLCQEFLAMKGVDFTFIATEPLPEARERCGYAHMNDLDFVLKMYESKGNQAKGKALIKEADIFINGAGTSYTRLRLRAKKPVYVYTERYFKDFGSPVRKTMIFRLASWLYHVAPFRRKDVRYLASSAFLAKDIAQYRSLKNKIFKWGYFIDPKEFATARDGSLHAPLSLLWVGRLLSWKRPEFAIGVLEELLNEGVDAELTLVGDGPEKERLVARAKERNLENRIHLIGAVSHTKTKQAYATADVFLFTSEYSEGWGAVLGEALSSGCVCFASEQAGATPFLVKDGFNGCMIKLGDVRGVAEKIIHLTKSKKDISDIQNNAMRTMLDLWSPKVAATRLLLLDDSLNCGKKVSFADGPCSEAEVLKEAWR